MREEVDAGLDRVDALPVGRGFLDAYLYGQGDMRSGQLGAALGYSHRVSEHVSVFADGSLWHDWGERTGLGWRALAGVRGKF